MSVRFNDKESTKFRVWLVENGLTLTKFAERCGVSKQYISDIINGKRNVTDSVRELFKKNGYELQTFDND